jgi:hypothetical protein
VGDDSVFKKYGAQLGLVGTWWSGQEKRVLSSLPPILVADRWFSDVKLMRQVATAHADILLVEGKSTYVFALPDGRQVKGHDLQTPSERGTSVTVSGVFVFCLLSDNKSHGGGEAYVWRSDTPVPEGLR